MLPGKTKVVQPTRLSALAGRIGAHPEEVTPGSDPVVSGISADSRSVAEGDLFVCMPSASRDTHAYLEAAVEKGAVAALVHSTDGMTEATRLGLPAILVEHTGSRFNFALGRICSVVFGDPTSRLRVFGVTGTNGKTTTAWMVRHALVAMGREACYLGTLGFLTSQGRRDLDNTTPFPVELWSLMREAEAAGATDLVMECSSHALFERRLSAVQFDAGVYTNLTQDHLDFHGTICSSARSLNVLSIAG